MNEFWKEVIRNYSKVQDDFELEVVGTNLRVNVAYNNVCKVYRVLIYNHDGEEVLLEEKDSLKGVEKSIASFNVHYL